MLATSSHWIVPPLSFFEIKTWRPNAPCGGLDTGRRVGRLKLGSSWDKCQPGLKSCVTLALTD